MTTLTWVNPTQNTDDTAFNPATDQAGVQISINGAPAVAVPSGAGTSFVLEQLEAFNAVAQGADYTVAVAAVSKAGGVSDTTGATFRKKLLQPKPVTELAVTTA